MKIIDEKGKLFGKINIVDFLVILFLLCILPAFYFGYKIMTKKIVLEKEEFIEIEADFQLAKLKPEVLKLISVGDKELDGNGQVIGEIISLGESEPYKYELDIGQGQKIIKADPILKQLKARVKLKTEVKEDRIYYKDKEIKIGLPSEFMTDEYSFKATPIIIAAAAVVVLVEVDCRLIKLKPEVLKLISVGDKELDGNGQVIGEIISLGQSTPYKYEFDIGKRQKIIKEDPILKQMRARVKLKAELRKNKVYYKDKEIKVGLPSEFMTDKYSIVAFLAKEVKIIGEKRIDLFVTLKDLDEDTLKQISVGDKEVDENGKTIAEILSLGKIENSSFELSLGSGNFVRGEMGEKKQISTKMRLKCRTMEMEAKRTGRLYFKGKEIEHNKPIEFNTDEYKAVGVVAKAFEVISPLKEKWLSLRVKFTGIGPEIASAVQKGDIEKDAFEKTVGRINLVISDKPSQVLSIKEDEFITLNHPFHRDILGSLDVLCVEKEGVYYFKNYPAKMGNNITFTTDLYSLTGTIVGVEMK